MSEPAVPWAAIGRVGLGSLLFLIGIGLLLPIFPTWVAGLARNGTEVGVATTFAIGVGLILARPLAGRLMEGRPRRPVLVAGILIGAASSFALPYAPTFPWVVALRLVQGIGFGLQMTAAMAAIADLAPPARRGELMGYFGAMNALSVIIGPLLGAAIARAWSAEVAFTVAGGLALLGLLPLAGLREPAAPKADPGARGLLVALAQPALRVLVTGHLLAILLHGAVVSFLPRRLEAHSGWVEVETFFAVQAATLVVFRAVVGKRFDTWGRGPFIFGGLALLSGASVLLGIGGGDAVYVAAALLYGLGFGAYVPATSAAVADVVPEARRARGFALYLLAFDLGFATGGAVVGPLVDRVGAPAAFLYAGAAPILAAAVFALGRARRSSRAC